MIIELLEEKEKEPILHCGDFIKFRDTQNFFDNGYAMGLVVDTPEGFALLNFESMALIRYYEFPEKIICSSSLVDLEKELQNDGIKLLRVFNRNDFKLVQINN